MTVPIKSNIPGVLGEIVGRTVAALPERSGRPAASAIVQPGGRRFRRRDVRPRHRHSPDGTFDQDPAVNGNAFYRSLTRPGLSLIAEIKPKSPSKGSIRDSDPVEIGRIYDRYASAISVLTEGPHFGGSFEMLAAVRSAVRVPILMKDFIVSEAQVVEGRARGADAVLLMASILPPGSIEALLRLARELGMEALVEVHSEDELHEVLGTSARIIGVNCRDLSTLRIDRSAFDRIAPQIPPDRLVVFESGIETRADVDSIRSRCDAVLIGTALMAAPDIEKKLLELLR